MNKKQRPRATPTGLRRLAKMLSFGHYSMAEAIQAIERAADEIERLRALSAPKEEMP